MEIKKSISNRTLTVHVKGNIDSNTSPQFEASLKEDINKANNLTLDLGECEYISSAGLRVILAARKFLNNTGEMMIVNATEPVMEVLRITGFTNIMKIEQK